MGLFFFHKAGKEKRKAEEIEVKLRQISEGLLRLEQKMEKMGEGKISIEHLNIERLENLTFRLEDLQIHELSGTLNIGNNLRTESSVVEKIISGSETGEEGKKETGTLKRTTNGYRYTPH